MPDYEEIAKNVQMYFLPWASALHLDAFSGLSSVWRVCASGPNQLQRPTSRPLETNADHVRFRRNRGKSPNLLTCCRGLRRCLSMRFLDSPACGECAASKATQLQRSTGRTLETDF